MSFKMPISSAHRVLRRGLVLTPVASSNANTDLEEYALKLDWNINDNHRASLRYSKLEQNKLRVQGMSSSGVSLSSYFEYTHQKSVESWVGQVFSDWTENFQY